MIVPDSNKTIKIPVTVKNGAVIFPDDFNLGALRKDFQTELILSETDFADKNLFHQLAKETEVDFLPEGTSLLVNVSTKERIAEKLEEKIIRTGKDTPQGKYGGFIEIILHAKQRMMLRGTKQGQLLDCPIFIPALPEEAAKSINHAYKIISTKFEPWRRSNTGSVFLKVFYRDENNGLWRTLNKHRDQVETENKKTISNSTK